jgi:phage protein D
VDTALAIKVGGAADAEFAQGAVVEVYERIGEPTTFSLRYQVDIHDQDLPRLRDARLEPGSEIQVLAVSGGAADCLVKGPVHSQKIRLLHGGTGSYVDVIGADTSVTMDREARSKVWDAVRDSDVVTQILATYGLEPDAANTAATHAEEKHTLVQRDSDLRFVRRLARRNGYLFWLTADPSGIQTAHFRRPPLDGAPAAKLAINLDKPTVNTLEIAWDVERPTSAQAMQLNLADKSDIDGSAPKSPLKLLGDKSLADITRDTRSVLVAAPVDDVGDLRSRGEAALVESDFFVRVTGETSPHALGAVLHAHTVVELQGAGRRHSGPYFVASVRHTIDALTHRMEFELARNGWGGS